jgi:predicted RNA-binding Zn-ribbon protein involved in translation (DUF1610 family)
MIANSSQSKASHQCPKCGSLKVVRSQRVNLLERVISLVNIYPYRCQQHICKHRFQYWGKNLAPSGYRRKA